MLNPLAPMAQPCDGASLSSPGVETFEDKWKVPVTLLAATAGPSSGGIVAVPGALYGSAARAG